MACGVDGIDTSYVVPRQRKLYSQYGPYNDSSAVSKRKGVEAEANLPADWGAWASPRRIELVATLQEISSLKNVSNSIDIRQVTPLIVGSSTLHSTSRIEYRE